VASPKVLYVGWVAGTVTDAADATAPAASTPTTTAAKPSPDFSPGFFPSA